MSLKYNLFLFCYFVLFTFAFGQTDSTNQLQSEKRRKQIIENEKITEKLQKSIERMEKSIAQTDSTNQIHSEENKKKIIEVMKITQQMHKDGMKADKNKETDELLLNVNVATISTIGYLLTELLDEKVVVGSRIYIYRFYVNMKLKRPFIIYVELEKGKPFVVSDKNKNNDKIEASRETFFQHTLSYLEDAKVAQDIKTEMERLLVKVLADCEKYKDCEHCWLIKNYNDDDD